MSVIDSHDSQGGYNSVSLVSDELVVCQVVNNGISTPRTDIIQSGQLLDNRFIYSIYLTD